MRKDMKFGLTIGGILVVTLVVFGVVLSHGDKSNDSQDIKVVQGDPQPANETVDKPAHPENPQPRSTPARTNAPSEPVVKRDEPASDIVPAVNNRVDKPVDPGINQAGGNAITAGATTTQPSDGTKWEDVLRDGLSKMAAQANVDRTVTPGNATATPPAPENTGGHALIDGGVMQADVAGPRTPAASVDKPAITSHNSVDRLPSDSHPEIGVAVHPATIDDITPTTQPSVDPPPTPASPKPVATATGKRTHTIAAGENLWTIAKAVYGNASYYDKILAANPGLNPKNLKVGHVLILPEITDASLTPSPAAGSPSKPQPTAKVDSTQAYEVVSGDSLEKIAIKLYHDATMKDKLYETNKTLIGTDENKLKIGMVLKLPQAPSVASAAH